MADVKLNVWTSPKDGQVRVYVDTRFLWWADEHKAAGGSYFYAGDDGLTRIHFQSSMSGEYGRAALGLRDYMRATDLPFADLLARINAALTPAGNFSAIRYFKALRAVEQAAIAKATSPSASIGGS